MAIRIETYDFVGHTADALGFAPGVRVDADNAYVRFTWTGELLKISSYATLHGAVATWVPEHDGQGGADEPWDVLLPVAAVRGLIQDFQLRGDKAQTILHVETVHDDMVITRAADEDGGVTAKRIRYPNDLDAKVQDPEKVFADLGPRDPDKDARLSQAVTAGLAKATKRTDHYATPVACQRGVLITVGEHLRVMAAYPTPVDQDKRDEDAIVAESQAHL